MRAIGFRVAGKTAVHYAVVSGSKEHAVLEDRGKITLQQNDDLPMILADLRSRLLPLFQDHAPEGIGVRLADLGGRQKTNAHSVAARSRSEGVILEVAGTERIATVAGPNATIKSKLKTKTSVRGYADSDDEFRGIDLAEIRNKEQREAIIVAVAALKE